MKVKKNRNTRISGIHILTTGTVDQHFEHRYGSNHPVLWWVLTSRSWITVPIHCFLIEHTDGVVLFDTGIDPAIVTDSNYIASPVGRFLLQRIFRMHIEPEDGLAHQLAGIGFSPSEVSKVVLSHLHFDHIGGIASVPQAELFVSADEWHQLSAPHPERDWILREHIEIPNAKWHSIEFEACTDSLFASFAGCHDLMGDGSMMLLPTPGHTPGSMSMLIRSDQLPPILLAGDLAYETDRLMDDRMPGIGDHDQLKASYASVRHIRDQLPDLIVLSSHDPDAARQLSASCSFSHPDTHVRSSTQGVEKPRLTTVT